MQHDFRPLQDMFRWQRAASLDGGDTWTVQVLDTQSPFFGYLINTSRTYWREETELRFGTDTDAAAAYLADNRFRIDGEGLTAGQVAEHKRNLLNKIFCIGYMLHRFKSPSRAWAPYAMDGKLGEDGECNGRSGKSFFFKALSIFLNTVTLSGRNPRLMDNPHVFDQVTRHTDMLQVDDCNRYLRPSLFFDNITSDMNVNPKNQQSYTIPFEESPKLAFSTNYVPSEFDPSTDARLLYMVFSDWYHQRTSDNDYRESRSIRDDFGRDLYAQTYPEELWNADLNFFLQCTRFYLDVSRTGEKLLPPMDGILLRKYKADMGKHFENWADVYFSPESGRLDTLVVRQEAYLDFKIQSGLKDLTTNSFSKMISAYAALSPHIHALNPKFMLNSTGRLIRKDSLGKTVEMIYLETEEAWRARNAQDEPKQAPAAHSEPVLFTPDPDELPMP